MKLFEKDGHTHSPYCPHRYTDDPLEDYIAFAEQNGLKELTFAEHMPMVMNPLPTPTPITFQNPDMDGIMQYFREIKAFRDSYPGQLKIKVGMEVDYIEGLEDLTKAMLTELGPHAEEIILSVHYLKIGDLYYYVANKDYVDNAVVAAGGAENLNKLYYETVLKSLRADLGPCKPTKVGHCPMIRMTYLKYPAFDENPEVLDELAREIKKCGYSVDLNMQGLRNEFCKEVFGAPLLPYIKKYNIPVVLGSDSHRANTLGVGFDHPSIMENISWLIPEWEA